MPNRIIKETITTSCEIDHLSADEERFFYRLIVSCDDFGRMDARPAVLRAKCFPLKVDKIDNNDIGKWLQKFVKLGLITLYKTEDKPYLFMVKWEKHQQRRAKNSKYPAPDSDMISNDVNGYQMQEDVTEESIFEESIFEESRDRKKKYAPSVNMKEEEYQKLIDRFGEPEALDRIERLSLYKKSTGRKYKCDYSTILAWARKDEKEKGGASIERPEEPGKYEEFYN